MLSYALVFAVACACYLNTLNAAFVHDDIFAIKENIDVNTHASTWSSVFFNDFWGKHIRSLTSWQRRNVGMSRAISHIAR
eukprot:m.389962 g.389962  ORF g.389962 m.389962 type:complete len:80 (+) comp56338_c0_seq4:10-249(+)